MHPQREQSIAWIRRRTRRHGRFVGPNRVVIFLDFWQLLC
jgi:hypothetical protein